MQGVVPELVRRAAGSTFLEVSRGSVRTVPLLLPPLALPALRGRLPIALPSLVLVGGLLAARGPRRGASRGEVAVEGHQQTVIRALLGEPGIAALHDTNGRWDLLADLRVSNLQELAAALERIRRIKGISATETSIHLQSYRG